MSSSVNPSKRRRLDPSSTLTKPFKSPLRKQPLPSPSTSTSTSTAEPPNKEPPSPPASQEPNPPPSPAPPPPPHPPNSKPQPSSRPHRAQLSQPQDPELVSLQKHHRTLASRLAMLRSTLDTTTQALRIENSSRDIELEALITRWRGVSQSAADEVFLGARERVCKMGGMRAWRERMRANSFEERWEEVGEDDEDEDGDGEREREEGKKDEVGEKEEDGDGEDELTMDVMLKTLNIEPGVIGWDGKGQRWIK